MRKFVLGLAMVLAAAGAACAEEYVLPLNVSGSYLHNTVRNSSFDLGRNFTQINSVSMRWKGTVTPGWWHWTVEHPSGPCETGFLAAIGSAEASTPRFKSIFDPSTGLCQPVSFDMVSTFELAQGQSWDSLLDGVGSITLELAYPTLAIGGDVSTLPRATLESASLVVDGTAVPEPSAALSLLAGISGFGLAAYRRSRG